MLNQLIESKNHSAENARKNGFLMTTLGVLVAVLLSGWTYSLFAKNFGMGTGDFELSSIVTPVVENEEPPAPEPEPRKNEKPQAVSDNEQLTVIDKVARMEDSLDKPPRLDESRKINSEPLKPSDWDKFKEGTENNYGRSKNGDNNGKGLGDTETSSKTDEEDAKMPEVVKPTPAPTAAKTPDNRPRTLGVVNGKATYLAKPPYPAAAKAMGVNGTVNVQVLIDEKGNVVSAAVTSGHPLLRAVSETAARQSKFTPTYLSNQPVRVTGIIVYQFKP